MVAMKSSVSLFFERYVCMQDLGARWSGCRRALLGGDEDVTVRRSGGDLQFAVQVLVYAESALVGWGLAVGAEPENVNISRRGQVCRPGKVGDLDVQLGISVGASSVHADDAAGGGNTAVGGHVVGFGAREWPQEEKQNQDGDAIHYLPWISRAGGRLQRGGGNSSPTYFWIQS